MLPRPRSLPVDADLVTCLLAAARILLPKAIGTLGFLAVLGLVVSWASSHSSSHIAWPSLVGEGAIFIGTGWAAGAVVIGRHWRQ